LPDFNQERFWLFVDLINKRVYFNDILVLGVGSFEDHAELPRRFLPGEEWQSSSKHRKVQICKN